MSNDDRVDDLQEAYRDRRSAESRDTLRVIIYLAVLVSVVSFVLTRGE